MEKTLYFGKVDFYGHGRKINTVDIEMELKEKDDGKIVFTASGNIWNSHHTDIVMGGQCIDEIAKLFPHNEKVQRIKKIWERWHLNDLHAGCKHQRNFESEPYENHRGAHCDICNYTYGTGWQYEAIPDNVIAEIKELMGE